MIAAYQATVVLLALLRVPVPWYLPLEHRWVIERSPRTLAMDFYGVTLYASVAAAVGYAIGHWVVGSSPKPLTADQAWLWLSWALAFAGLAMAMMAYRIWPRPPTPLPPPPWYHPL
jgi:hypothetical protein